ncbi:MAG: hypothetical protein ACKPEA_03715 [Planctomycetota bacterium]
MSQQQNGPVFVKSETPQEWGGNALGLAGFITSLFGVVMTAGFLCPVGLILSLVALRRQPRGFAIAGTVIGLLGSCGGCFAIAIGVPLLAGGAVLLAALGFIAGGGVPALHTIDHMLQVRSAIETFEKANGKLPASLADLNMPKDMLEDGWGTPLQYQTSQQGTTMKWTLQSAGPDRQLDKDDITFDGSMTVVQQPAPSSAKP